MEGLGKTESESYLAALCQRTFLSLWSYPNPYYDKKAVLGKGDGKELCDLLVVFGDSVIIFSDKSCEFPRGLNLQTDWRRWYDRAIDRSVNQIYGAERWIREFPSRIFRDPACQYPLPVELPPYNSARVHRVVVAHGAAERCQEELHGGSGSLMLMIEGRISKGNPSEPLPPFAIGRLGNDNQPVHLFDDTTLDLVLQRLDTITDFVQYLERKEEFIASGVSVFAPGEEELLADYLTHTDASGQHGFTHADGVDAYMLDEGTWDAFEASLERQAQISADETSYFWDELIEIVPNQISSGKLRAEDIDISMAETILRHMAVESRFHRRMLSDRARDLFSRPPRPGMRYTRIVPSFKAKRAYVFMTLARTPSIKEKDYRAVRIEVLDRYCQMLMVLDKNAETVVGIATAPGTDKVRSFDFVFNDRDRIMKIGEAEIRKEAEFHGMFRHGLTYQMTELEYPVNGGVPVRIPKMRGKDRNLPCPCGSGIKFKHCCGKDQRLSLMPFNPNVGRPSYRNPKDPSPWQPVNFPED